MHSHFPRRTRREVPNLSENKGYKARRTWGIVGSLLALSFTLVLLIWLAGCASSSFGSNSTSITSLTPSSGTQGTAVVIAGSNFGSSQATANGSVTFDGTPAPVMSWSNAQIVVDVPAGANSGSVVVTSSGKTSGGSAFTVLTTSTQGNCETNSDAAATFSGMYAYEIRGFQGSGQVGTPYVRVGSITVVNGAITSGEEDFNLGTSGDDHHTVSTSTLTVGPDFRGCMTLNYSDSPKTATFRFSIGTFAGTSGSAERGHIIEFDDGTGSGLRGSGTIMQQNASDFLPAQLNLNYAFGFEGIDSSHGHVSEIGTFTLNPSGTGNNISNGFMDVNDAGSLTFGASGTAGATVGAIATEPAGTILSTSGRTTATIVAEPGCVATCTWHYAVYIVTANIALFMSSDNLSSSPLVAGRAVATAASFTAAGLAAEQESNSLGLLLYLSGSHASVAEAELGQISLNSTGNAFTSTLLSYTSGSSGSSNPLGTFAVSSAGRLTFSGTNIIAYLTNPAGADSTAGFIMDTSNEAMGGLLLVHAGAVVNPNGSPQPSPAGFSFGSSLMGDATVINGTGEAGVVVTSGGGSNDSLSVAQDESGEASPFLDTNTFTNIPFTFSATGQITATTDAIGNTVVGWADQTGIFFIDESGSAALFIGQQ